MSVMFVVICGEEKRYNQVQKKIMTLVNYIKHKINEQYGLL